MVQTALDAPKLIVMPDLEDNRRIIVSNRVVIPFFYFVYHWIDLVLSSIEQVDVTTQQLTDDQHSKNPASQLLIPSLTFGYEILGTSTSRYPWIKGRWSLANLQVDAVLDQRQFWHPSSLP